MPGLPSRGGKQAHVLTALPGAGMWQVSDKCTAALPCSFWPGFPAEDTSTSTVQTPGKAEAWRRELLAPDPKQGPEPGSMIDLQGSDSELWLPPSKIVLQPIFLTESTVLAPSPGMNRKDS